ncbi:MAG: GGDEF domain-containing protein [gamma proteobacterium symbiont of Taylorina sp.]|nr:GGDEF domain-containing protein [gamma proteobacterium symbiont of Taylorina sp.]
MKFDIFIIIIVNVGLFFVFSKIDALELLYEYSKQHEDFELDEVLVIFISLSFSLAIFALRRLRESKILVAEITELAVRDSLTKLFNRRYFNRELEIEVNKAQRSNNHFSVIMMDLDYFKAINDTYGHNVGDKVLYQVSQLYTQSCRETDLVARWGGEEFIILCYSTQLEGAVELGNKILETVSNFNFNVVEHITVSIGVTTFAKNDSAETIIKRADKYLYIAKDEGRNILRHS